MEPLSPRNVEPTNAVPPAVSTCRARPLTAGVPATDICDASRLVPGWRSSYTPKPADWSPIVPYTCRNPSFTSYVTVLFKPLAPDSDTSSKSAGAPAGDQLNVPLQLPDCTTQVLVTASASACTAKSGSAAARAQVDLFILTIVSFGASLTRR